MKPATMTGILYTQSGRAIPCPPPLLVKTERQARQSCQAIDEWLLSQAGQEARATGQEYVEVLCAAKEARSLTSGDRALLNSILFGDPDGPGGARVSGGENGRADAPL